MIDELHIELCLLLIDGIEHEDDFGVEVGAGEGHWLKNDPVPVLELTHDVADLMLTQERHAHRPSVLLPNGQVLPRVNITETRHP